MRDEVTPKNILMIGPTGVGKTEIARRLARLVKAPFIKVEATKFTEVGYVGRDVDSIVRDLVETAVRMVKEEQMEAVRDKAEERAEERLVEIMAPMPHAERAFNPFTAMFGMGHVRPQTGSAEADSEERTRVPEERKRLKELLALGELEDRIVEIEVEDHRPPVLEVFSGAGSRRWGINLQDLFGNLLPKRKQRRRVPVSEARRILAQEEAQNLIDMEEVIQEAIRRSENAGIIFIDEIDKIAGREGGAGPDVSREGVQRDILPIIEGATVMTKYGPVRTDHYVVYCGRGLSRLEAVGSDSRASGAFSDSRGTRFAHAGRFRPDLDRAEKRLDEAVCCLAGDGISLPLTLPRTASKRLRVLPNLSTSRRKT